MTQWWWLGFVFLLIGIGTYMYMQRGKKEQNNAFNYMNLMVTMLLGGLWHGAGWAFIFWGFLHGSYLVVQRFLSKPFGSLMRGLRMPKWMQIGINVAIVYALTSLAWIFFRSPDFETAMSVISGIANTSTFTFGSVINKFDVLTGGFLIALLLSVELSDLRLNFSQLSLKSPAFRVVSFALLLLAIAFFGTFDSNAFIYFQF